MKESGHYSIAGFFFQQLASATDALKLYFNQDSDDDPAAVFVLEKHGQDGVVKPVCGTSGKIKLIQYKYSTVGSKIEPSDLRDILVAFSRSVEDTERPLDEFEFSLTTNRVLSDAAEKWFVTPISEPGFKKNLHKNLKKESIEKYDPAVLFPIFQNLTHELRDLQACQSEITAIADQYGMLEHEVKNGIDTVVVECPQKLVHGYEGSDCGTNFTVGSFCGGSAANGTEAAHCEANSAGVKPPRPLCGRRWLYV